MSFRPPPHKKRENNTGGSSRTPSQLLNLLSPTLKGAPDKEMHRSSASPTLRLSPKTTAFVTQCSISTAGTQSGCTRVASTRASLPPIPEWRARPAGGLQSTSPAKGKTYALSLGLQRVPLPSVDLTKSPPRTYKGHVHKDVSPKPRAPTTVPYGNRPTIGTRKSPTAERVLPALSSNYFAKLMGETGSGELSPLSSEPVLISLGEREDENSPIAQGKRAEDAGGDTAHHEEQKGNSDGSHVEITQHLLSDTGTDELNTVPVDMNGENLIEILINGMANLAGTMSRVEQIMGATNSTLKNIDEGIKGINDKLDQQGTEIQLLPHRIISSIREMSRSSSRASRTSQFTCSPSPPHQQYRAVPAQHPGARFYIREPAEPTALTLAPVANDKPEQEDDDQLSYVPDEAAGPVPTLPYANMTPRFTSCPVVDAICPNLQAN